LQETIKGDLQRRPQPKFSLNERVKGNGWGGSDYGIVIGIKWIYHLRLFEYTWGYNIKWENNGIGVTYKYIPEGYLEKI
jgi:hypothetical protein